MNKCTFKDLSSLEKYNYIIKRRKEWSNYESFNPDNIKFILIILGDISILNSSELKVLSNLAIYASPNEILGCFIRYRNMDKIQKCAHTLIYYQTVFGDIEGNIRYNLYRNNNANMVREGISKRTDCKTTSILCIEYWLKKGMNYEEAKNKISAIQQANSLKYHKKYKENNKPYSNGKQLQYYLDKGHTLENAKKLLSENQATFSYKKCIETYGLELGEDVFKNRQIKWQNTLNALPDDIKEKILISKIVSFGKSSKESLLYFIPLYKKLRKLGVLRKDIYFGVSGSKEYRLKGELGIRMFDFCILSHKIIIEFNGIKWHAKSKADSEIRYNPFGASLIKSWENDCYKKTLAINNGFNIITLWSDEEDNNLLKINSIINQIYWN